MKTSSLAEAYPARSARRRKPVPGPSRTTLRECIVLRDPTDCLLEAYDCVARCAYANFLARESKPGRELDDWLNAEREVLLGLSVHVQQSADSVYAMASVPGATAARISVGIESRWLVILAHTLPAPTPPIGRKNVNGQATKHGPLATDPFGGDGAPASATRNIRSEARVDEDRLQSRHVCILELPVSVDATRSIAVLADGLLAIRMPKTAAAARAS